jgi:hypothetical protein
MITSGFGIDLRTPQLAASFISKLSVQCRLLARNGLLPMSDVSPLSGVKLKSNCGAVRTAFDPKRQDDQLFDRNFCQSNHLGKLCSFALNKCLELCC